MLIHASKLARGRAALESTAWPSDHPGFSLAPVCRDPLDRQTFPRGSPPPRTNCSLSMNFQALYLPGLWDSGGPIPSTPLCIRWGRGKGTCMHRAPPLSASPVNHRAFEKAAPLGKLASVEL